MKKHPLILCCRNYFSFIECLQSGKSSGKQSYPFPKPNKWNGRKWKPMLFVHFGLNTF